MSAPTNEELEVAVGVLEKLETAMEKHQSYAVNSIQAINDARMNIPEDEEEWKELFPS